MRGSASPHLNYLNYKLIIGCQYRQEMGKIPNFTDSERMKTPRISAVNGNSRKFIANPITLTLTRSKSCTNASTIWTRSYVYGEFKNVNPRTVQSMHKPVWTCKQIRLIQRSNRHLHKSTKISLRYSWEGIMQALPWVTHGKDLCKTCHQLLLGRNYAESVLHKSFIIYNLYTIFMGRIYAKVEKSKCLLIAL